MPTSATISKAAELWGFHVHPKNARDRLLLKAVDLFYYNGFNAIGLDRILAETGVTKTTFYKHFESKDDLVLAAIEKRNEWEGRAFQKALIKQAGKDPIAQLIAHYDVLDEWFNHPNFNGCLFINVAGEFPNPNDPAHKAAANHKHEHRALVIDLATRGNLRTPEAFADVYLTLFEGTLIMRHVHGRNDAARATKPVVEKLIEQYRTQPAVVG